MLFKNKYRVETTRLKYWDYSSNGIYFVTICTKNRAHYFGEIIGQKMELSDLGKIAEKCWYEIPLHFPFVVLDEFVVMPNHIHGILIINKPVETQNIASENENMSTNTKTQNIASDNKIKPTIHVETQNIAPENENMSTNMETQNIASDNKIKPTIHVETQNIASLQEKPSTGKFGPQSKNLASIIRGYKIGVTKFAKQNDIPFQWQPRYYDHIIRNEKSFYRIKNYIIHNPMKWKEDKMYSK